MCSGGKQAESAVADATAAIPALLGMIAGQINVNMNYKCVIHLAVGYLYFLRAVFEIPRSVCWSP